jgi:hypothetical protein
MSERISSRISARVDFAFRLRGQESEPLINITHIVPLGVNFARNKPAEADTCSVEVFASDFPFDLRLVAPRGGLMYVWLYEHGDPERCKYGDPGMFAGPIDEMTRTMEDRKITLRGRDWTSFLLDSKLGEGVLAKINVDKAPSLSSIVREILDTLEGGETWQIEELTTSASRPISTPAVRPAERRKGSKAKPPRTVLTQRFKHMASVLPKQGEVSAWDAIAAVSARLGVVPEIGIDREGRPKVVMVAAEDLNTSSVIRPFKRGANTFRTMTVGGDITMMSETVDLMPHNNRPDFVAVASINRETGRSVVAEWPKPGVGSRKRRGKSQNETGLYQTIEGLETIEAVEAVAKAAWDSLAQNEFRVTIATPVPWSTGGTPDDPDLLDLAYGAAVAIDYSGFEQLANRTPSQILQAQGLPAAVAERIQRAQSTIGRLSLLFLVVTVDHEWRGGASPSYMCRMTLRQTLNGQVA